MIIFYSGSCGMLPGLDPAGEPETILRESKPDALLLPDYDQGPAATLPLAAHPTTKERPT